MPARPRLEAACKTLRYADKPARSANQKIQKKPRQILTGLFCRCYKTDYFLVSV